MNNKFLILDFGSQYTQLIARRLRELNFYSEIFPFDVDLEEIKSFNPSGIILSGGPHSVYEKEAPIRDIEPLKRISPLLGVCYGMQLINQELGGRVTPANNREYGDMNIHWVKTMSERWPKKFSVWMSHGDIVEETPPELEVYALSEINHPAVLQSKDKKILCYQFHPEVFHSQYGKELIAYFVEDICQAKPTWTAKNIIEHIKSDIIAPIPDNEIVLCALSGGVDSTVVATLLTQSLGRERVKCVFVNNGLLRANEVKEVMSLYSELDLNVDCVDAEESFLTALKGVSDPETKRKIIGHTFIEVFKSQAKTWSENLNWLAQGTLYPDVIESVSLRGQNVTIKSHHNVGGLPKDLGLKLVEPLRELFKDEVRTIGRALGIPEKFLMRHPFPGPGLAIRVLGAIDSESLETLRQCDKIYIEALKSSKLYDSIWQAFCVLLPVQTVGVQGDSRTYEKVCALRAVTSQDGMTAKWFEFDYDFLQKVSSQITNQVKGVNRVVYDVTSKPPGTIEWE
jgi:GMP synthase (glutamine-hydrolysing)